MTFQIKNKEFRNAYDNYYPVVFNILISKIKSREDAEDICQEVFEKFYKKFREIEDKKSWLYGAVRLEIMYYYRKKGRPGPVMLDIDEFENHEKLGFVNGARDLRIILNEAISGMENFKDEKEKLLFDLIALNNYTYEQASRQLGMTRRKVEYSYAKISKKILSFLRKRGVSSLEEML